jgi:hypothetical protein
MAMLTVIIPALAQSASDLGNDALGCLALGVLRAAAALLQVHRAARLFGAALRAGAGMMVMDAAEPAVLALHRRPLSVAFFSISLAIAVVCGLCLVVGMVVLIRDLGGRPPRPPRRRRRWALMPTP